MSYTKSDPGHSAPRRYKISDPEPSDSEVFHSYSNERKVNLGCLEQHLPDALRKLQLGEGKETLKILSIGAGDGESVDHKLFRIVKEEYLNAENQLQDVKMKITAVEPHQDYKASYFEAFETPLRQDEVTVDFRQEKFESYMQSQDHVPNQYDLIQAIHSLYFVRPLESTLKHCYDHELGDKGLIVCIVAGEDCIYNLVREALMINRQDKKVRTPLRHAERIKSLAMENRWEISQFRCPITIDVTGIVNETLTEDGKVLFDFMTKEKKFFDTADRDSVNAVLEKLKEISKEEDDGKITVEEGNELLVIYKKPQE